MLLPLKNAIPHRMLHSTPIADRLESLLSSIKNSSPPTFPPMEKTLSTKNLKSLEEKISLSLKELSFDKVKNENEESFGNKCEKLFLMKRFLETIDRSDIIIPSLIGISSEKIHSFLQKSAPEALIEWENLKKLHSDTGSNIFVFKNG